MPNPRLPRPHMSVVNSIQTGSQDAFHNLRKHSYHAEIRQTRLPSEFLSATWMSRPCLDQRLLTLETHET
jgi:hypothetical protein